jgi:hypothetical protein
MILWAMLNAGWDRWSLVCMADAHPLELANGILDPVHDVAMKGVVTWMNQRI